MKTTILLLFAMILFPSCALSSTNDAIWISTIPFEKSADECISFFKTQYDVDLTRQGETLRADIVSSDGTKTGTLVLTLENDKLDYLTYSFHADASSDENIHASLDLYFRLVETVQEKRGAPEYLFFTYGNIDSIENVLWYPFEIAEREIVYQVADYVQEMPFAENVCLFSLYDHMIIELAFIESDHPLIPTIHCFSNESDKWLEAFETLEVLLQTPPQSLVDRSPAHFVHGAS